MRAVFQFCVNLCNTIVWAFFSECSSLKATQIYKFSSLFAWSTLIGLFLFFCLRKPFWFVYFYLLHSIKIVIWCLNFEQVKVWTLINLMNNIVIVLVCAKCLKLITSEENVRQKKKVLLFLEMQVTKKIFTGMVAIKKKFYQFKWFFQIKFSDKKLI